MSANNFRNDDSAEHDRLAELSNQHTVELRRNRRYGIAYAVAGGGAFVSAALGMLQITLLAMAAMFILCMIAMRMP